MSGAYGTGGGDSYGPPPPQVFYGQGGGYPPQNTGYPPGPGVPGGHGYPPPQGFPPTSAYVKPDNESDIIPDVTPQPPSSKGFDTRPGKEKYNRAPKYKDVWAAALFLVHFMVFLAFSVLFFVSLPSSAFSRGGSTGEFFSYPTWVSLAGASITGLITSLLFLVLVQVFTKGIIVASFWFSVALFLGLAIFYIVEGVIFFGVILLVFAVFYALSWKGWKQKIPFSTIVLRTDVFVIRKFPSTVAFSVVWAVVAMGYTFWWAVSMSSAVSYLKDRETCQTQLDRNGRPHEVCTNPALYVTWVALVFSLYWTSQVLANTLHTAVSGLFATYYFFDGTEQGYPSRFPMGAAVRRALTYSFGSICFGSLLVALLQTVRAVVRSMLYGDDTSFCAILCLAIVDCILGVLEGLLRIFNKYAYIEIAIYGKSFVDAARDTWALVKDRGIDTLINDILIGNVITLGNLSIAASSALAAYLLLLAIHPDYLGDSSGFVALLIIMAFLIGLVVANTVTGVIGSGTSATFVCLAEDPHALARNKPELFSEIARSYPEVVQGVHA